MKKSHEKLLRDIADGWEIRQTRLSHMKVRVEMSRGRQIPKTVNESVVRSLCEDGYLEAHPLDSLWDRVEFRITGKGWAVYHGLTGKAL